MLLLSLLELAFGQLFFNHMRVCVCVPVWGLCSHLIKNYCHLMLLVSLVRTCLRLLMSSDGDSCHLLLLLTLYRCGLIPARWMCQRGARIVKYGPVASKAEKVKIHKGNVLDL